MSHIELLFRGELQSFEQQYRMLWNISLFCILRKERGWTMTLYSMSMISTICSCETVDASNPSTRRPSSVKYFGLAEEERGIGE